MCDNSSVLLLSEKNLLAACAKLGFQEEVPKSNEVDVM